MTNIIFDKIRFITTYAQMEASCNCLQTHIKGIPLSTGASAVLDQYENYLRKVDQIIDYYKVMLERDLKKLLNATIRIESEDISLSKGFRGIGGPLS